MGALNLQVLEESVTGVEFAGTGIWRYSL